MPKHLPQHTSCVKKQLQTSTADSKPPTTPFVKHPQNAVMFPYAENRRWCRRKQGREVRPKSIVWRMLIESKSRGSKVEELRRDGSQ